MTRRLLSCSVSLTILLTLVLVGPAGAENAGQADLDQAVQVKAAANTSDDLGEVIRHCETALKKGLDKSNTQFANSLLAATLTQRGELYAAKIFASLPADPAWPAQRKVALADLQRALALDPKQPQALYTEARLDLSLAEGNVHEGREALDKAIALSDDDPSLKAQALVLRADNCKDLPAKLADLDEAARVAPGDASALRARGLVRADLGKLDAALDDLNRAIEIDPQQLMTYEVKALVLARQDKFDEAHAVLDQALRIDGKALEIRVQKARFYSLQAKYKPALAELDKAAALDPKNLTVLLLRAAVYEETGEKTKALADLEQALALRPTLPQAMRDRALLLSDLGRNPEAVTQLEKLHNLVPEDAQTTLQLGLLYNAVKKYQQALETFAALVKEHPQEWMAWRGRGDSLLALGRRGPAIADYDKALTLKPKDPGLLNNLSWLLATAPEEKFRDGQRAVVLAVEACQQTSYKESYILSTLAAAYAETGDFASAVKWSTKALELGGKDPAQAADLKKELESYQAGKPWRENAIHRESSNPNPNKSAKR